MKLNSPERINNMEFAYKTKNGWQKPSVSKEEIFDFCEKYKEFMNSAKTEREFASLVEEKIKKEGFAPLASFSELKQGDKVYAVNRGKGLMLAIIGSEDIEKGITLIGSHIDAPRLDLKPNPLYEDGDMALLKTHYYGGIKKYQWTTIPLAMHGSIILADGKKIDIAIGDDGDDITFTITDLLPHLSAEQVKKTLDKAIEGEDLNIVFGSIPLPDKDEKEPFKAAILTLLNNKYGMCEEDFISAEIEFVPAFAAKDVGIDRGLIGAPGHDDRVCAYTSLQAILETVNPKKTAVCILVDKEEVGSMGVTGMRSRFFENIMAEILSLMGKGEISLRRCFSSSICLSADVCAAWDPNYTSVMDKNNSAKVSHGIAIMKYTGARGKSGASDATAELMGRIRKIFNDNGVLWQSTELGKVDAGGGGTIAQYVANLNIDTLDCGVPILSMHSPYEVASKMDIYMAYLGYKAFFCN